MRHFRGLYGGSTRPLRRHPDTRRRRRRPRGEAPPPPCSRPRWCPAFLTAAPTRRPSCFLPQRRPPPGGVAGASLVRLRGAHPPGGRAAAAAAARSRRTVPANGAAAAPRLSAPHPTGLLPRSRRPCPNKGSPVRGAAAAAKRRHGLPAPADAEPPPPARGGGAEGRCGGSRGVCV